MPTGLILAINASALIERSEALSTSQHLRPAHFSHFASLAGARLIQISAEPVALRPTHFDNPHSFGGATLVASAGDDTEIDMTPRRFWRIYLQHQNSNAFALDTLQFRETNGGGQGATGGTAIEGPSGHFGGEVPANAFDASTTKWSANAGTPGEWLGYDLGSGNAKDFVEVMIKSYTSEQAQTPDVFIVEKGDDGVNWLVAWHVQTTPDWGAAETRVFPRPA